MSFLPKIVRSMQDKNVYLTFDDGPDGKITPRLLELLDKHDTKATFFLVGQKAECFPEVVLQIHNNGHSIGNHSYTHPHLIFKSKELIKKEIQRTDETLFEITGRHPKLFRPPYGQFGFSLLKVLNVMNRRMILWSASSQDYKTNSSSDKIQKRMRRIIQPGRIVLMHDGHLQSPHTFSALENALWRYKDQGFNFSAIPN